MRQVHTEFGGVNVSGCLTLPLRPGSIKFWLYSMGFTLLSIFIVIWVLFDRCLIWCSFLFMFLFFGEVALYFLLLFGLFFFDWIVFFFVLFNSRIFIKIDAFKGSTYCLGHSCKGHKHQYCLAYFCKWHKHQLNLLLTEDKFKMTKFPQFWESIHLSQFP